MGGHVCEKKKKETTENEINSYDEQRYEVDALKCKIQRWMRDGGSQKSEAKVEVGNGKSEVGRPSCALNKISFKVST